MMFYIYFQLMNILMSPPSIEQRSKCILVGQKQFFGESIYHKLFMWMHEVSCKLFVMAKIVKITRR